MGNLLEIIMRSDTISVLFVGVEIKYESEGQTYRPMSYESRLQIPTKSWLDSFQDI